MKISLEKIDFFFYIFAQNILCGYTTAEAVLTSTHSVCFGSKIRESGIPLQTPVFLYIYNSGVQGGIHFTDMFSLCKHIKRAVRETLRFVILGHSQSAPVVRTICFRSVTTTLIIDSIFHFHTFIFDNWQPVVMK